MENSKIALIFTCPGSRIHGGTKKLCRGVLGGIFLDSPKPTILLYCSKCGSFWKCEPKDDGYHVSVADKSDVKMVPMPFVLDENGRGQS